MPDTPTPDIDPSATSVTWRLDDIGAIREWLDTFHVEGMGIRPADEEHQNVDGPWELYNLETDSWLPLQEGCLIVRDEGSYSTAPAE